MIKEKHLKKLQIKKKTLNVLQEVIKDFLIKTFEKESQCN